MFCSKGDNITPPQQALGWILDLYDNVDEIRSFGQTIVYTVHETVGHLGIFVSGGVARKEHGEFSSNIDLIDTLPPGLYEAVFERKTGDTANPDLITGDWVMRCEARTLDDIRALGGNDAADERRFATAARVSEMNLALYRTFAQPLVRAHGELADGGMAASSASAPAAVRVVLQRQPGDGPVAGTSADQVRENRKPVAADNPFARRAGDASPADRQCARSLARHRTRRWRNGCSSRSTARRALQAAVGVDPPTIGRPARRPKNPLHHELLESRIADLKARISAGGLREALIRGLLYAGMSRAAVDERGFEMVRADPSRRTTAAVVRHSRRWCASSSACC